MPRTDRLFRLLQAMRRLRAPVTAARLAAETEVSLRTLYRDIAALRAAGARIEGEAGLGYTLTEDPALPPQSFTRLEIEALVLGLSEVQQRADQALALAAAEALAKIAATLPEPQRRHLTHAVNTAYRFNPVPADAALLDLLREAAWEEQVLHLHYRDRHGAESARDIWPLALVYFDREMVLLAWCGLRRDFRQFLPGSILRAERTGASFRPRRVPLLRDYSAQLARRVAAARAGEA